MRMKSSGAPQRVEFDMTPMIDCVFQLVIFFMLTLNFSSDQQAEAVRLPASELAKPSDQPPGTNISLQLTGPIKRDDGSVIPPQVLVGADVVPLAQVKNALLREKEVLTRTKGDHRAATIVIRADIDTPTGKVQELIRSAQEVGFEKFVLRAKEGDPLR